MGGLGSTPLETDNYIRPSDLTRMWRTSVLRAGGMADVEWSRTGTALVVVRIRRLMTARSSTADWIRCSHSKHRPWLPAPSLDLTIPSFRTSTCCRNNTLSPVSALRLSVRHQEARTLVVF